MSVPTKEKSSFYRSVFRRTLANYDEFKATVGSNSCQQFYKSLSQEGGKGTGINPRIVHMSPIDFICDVEIVARKFLNQQEYRFFKLVYLDKDEELVNMARDTFRTTKKSVQEKLGQAFVESGIHPFAKYMRPIDLR
jgi:hypothetical protein